MQAGTAGLGEAYLIICYFEPWYNWLGRYLSAWLIFGNLCQYVRMCVRASCVVCQPVTPINRPTVRECQGLLMSTHSLHLCVCVCTRYQCVQNGHWLLHVLYSPVFFLFLHAETLLVYCSSFCVVVGYLIGS